MYQKVVKSVERLILIVIDFSMKYFGYASPNSYIYRDQSKIKHSCTTCPSIFKVSLKKTNARPACMKEYGNKLQSVSVCHYKLRLASCYHTR